MVEYVIQTTEKEATMDKLSISVGSTLTTAKSGVTGEVKEIVNNANGSLRVRLDVNGQDRWTTVK
jgi:hypothetical protein